MPQGTIFSNTKRIADSRFKICVNLNNFTLKILKAYVSDWNFSRFIVQMLQVCDTIEIKTQKLSLTTYYAPNR